MKGFLIFRKMVSPVLIQILFWLALIFFVYIAISDVVARHWLVALQVIILGPLAARVICEVLILSFRINDNLIAIKHRLSKD